MKNISRWRWVEIAVIAFFAIWFWNVKLTEKRESQEFTIALQQLRGVTKLVIWEQDFQLTDLSTAEKTYFSLFSTKESVVTTIKGRMGFHIDLADSVHTIIDRTPDTIFVKAPLRLTYVNLDLGTLQQVKEASLDPTLELNKETIVKQLSTKAVAQFVPQVNAQLKTKSLTEQESKLSALAKKPVRIILTSYPCPQTNCLNRLYLLGCRVHPPVYYLCPVRKYKKPEIAEQVLVENYAAEGKSLGRINGKVVFIENAVPGDVVDVLLYKNKKDWAEGSAVKFISYSPERVTPFCRHFGVCGGCQWQMLPYEKQLQYKQQQVADNIGRIAKLPLPPIFPIIGCDTTTRYRNKLEYTFCTKKFIPAEEFRQLKAAGQGTGNQPAAGFHAKGFFDKVVEISECHLQHEPTNGLRNAVAAYARESGLEFYDMRQHTGWLRNMIVRTTTTGEIMVNLVLGYEHKEHREKLLGFIMEHFPAVTTLLYTINTKHNDSIFDLVPQTWHGQGFITEKLEDFKFKISPKSFFQTNTRQAENLYRITRDFAALTGSETVYDLYCGTGSIGIFLSGGAKKIIGVEAIEEAIEDARENAALNNIEHASFYAGDVTDICTDAFFETNGRPDVIITDPPRAGMHGALVEKLLQIAAPLVVYVSCNPATQARDLGLLGEKYSVEKIQPVDMFPHTLHIENVVQLRLKNDLAKNNSLNGKR